MVTAIQLALEFGVLDWIFLAFGFVAYETGQYQNAGQIWSTNSI
jgi:hypothetical protein